MPVFRVCTSENVFRGFGNWMITLNDIIISTVRKGGLDFLSCPCTMSSLVSQTGLHVSQKATD